MDVAIIYRYRPTCTYGYIVQPAEGLVQHCMVDLEAICNNQ